MSRVRLLLLAAATLVACDDDEGGTQAQGGGGATGGSTVTSPAGSTSAVGSTGATGGSGGGEHTTPTPQWPFDRPSLDTLSAAPRKVYAHWHWFPTSFDDKRGDSDYYANAFMTPGGENGSHLAYGGYLRERPLGRLPRGTASWRTEDGQHDAALARAIGIDGFFVNVWDSTTLQERWMALFEGAARVPGFSVAPNFDLSIMSDLDDGPLLDFMIEFLGSVADQPALLREDGRVVVGMFHGGNRSVELYQDLRNRAEADLGLELYLVPVFLGLGSDAFFETYADVVDRFAGWGTAVPAAADSAENAWSSAQAHGRPWMHPLLAQDFRPYTGGYWEAEQSMTLRSGWEGAIASDTDWVQVVTWNDHAEHHALRPSTGKQWAYYDLAAYYITWLKMGAPPPIVRDALYYFHRIHPLGAQPTSQTELADCKANCDYTLDEIEVVTFATAPATLEVTQNGSTSTYDVPAGVQSTRVAAESGRPAFRLVRSGAEITLIESAFDIRDEVAVQDLLYRGGGSLRHEASPDQGCAARCEADDAMGCLACETEPVWLVANPD